MATTPLFTKTYDFITWLVEVTQHFPKSQRFVITKRLLDAALDFQEYIVEANAFRGPRRMEKLNRSDAELDKVRLYLRLSFRWEWLTRGQYNHAAGQISEIGNLLGAWKKITQPAAK